MCKMLDGLVPVSSSLLTRLLPCRVTSGTSGSACITGIAAATISWTRRWHRRVAAITRLWRSLLTISRRCSPELAAKRGEWRKIIQRTDGWREREKEQAEANAAARRERRRATARNREPRAPQAGSSGYATVPPPPPGDSSGSNARDARAAARDAAREQANQQQGGYWN